MLFFMGSATHLPNFLAEASLGVWYIAMLVIVVAVEAHALIGPGLPSQKPLTSVSGTIHAGLALTAVLYIIGCLV